MLSDNTVVHCDWCGVSCTLFDLDLNEYDEPSYCPNCGSGMPWLVIRTEEEE